MEISQAGGHWLTLISFGNSSNSEYTGQPSFALASSEQLLVFIKKWWQKASNQSLA